MKYLFLLLLIGCSNISYSQSLTIKQPYCDEMEGLQITNLDSVPSDYSGVVYNCYSNHKHRNIKPNKARFMTLYKSGKINGAYITWWNGLLNHEQNFKDGLRNGACRDWYTFRISDNNNSKDSIKKNSYFMIDDGSINYNETKYKRELRQELYYKNDTIDGLFRYWYRNGHLKKEYNFKNGIKHGLCIDWYENGQLNMQEQYKDGKLDGLIRYWYENGQMKIEGYYKDGQLDGLYRMWYENGQMKTEANYTGYTNYWRPKGRQREWYENGNLKEERNYKNGIQHGLHIDWYENGQMKQKSIFNEGTPLYKKLKCFDKSGKRVKCFDQNGKFIFSN